MENWIFPLAKHCDESRADPSFAVVVLAGVKLLDLIDNSRNVQSFRLDADQYRKVIKLTSPQTASSDIGLTRDQETM